jgi:hypothetical protein
MRLVPMIYPLFAGLKDSSHDLNLEVRPWMLSLPCTVASTS